MVKIIENLEQAIKAWDVYFNSDLSYHYKRNKHFIIEIITAFFRIQEDNLITKESIKIIRDGLSHSWEVIFHDCAGALIVEFAPSFPELENIILELSHSKKWLVRRNIILISSMIKNVSLKNLIIHNGMSDASKRCRKFAYNELLHIDKLTALDYISRHLNNESDNKLKKYLIEISDILKNGYTIWKDYSKSYIIKNKYAIWQVSKELYSKMTKDEIINYGNGAYKLH
ncbi:hypothetical protein JW835_13675 [bacterium]|nr:hypothetical protein [bacterium]